MIPDRNGSVKTKNIWTAIQTLFGPGMGWERVGGADGLTCRTDCVPFVALKESEGRGESFYTEDLLNRGHTILMEPLELKPGVASENQL
jgi:hypothetical protein